MEMEPDIENMTLNEYLEYEAMKERRLWDNVRSKSSLTSFSAHTLNKPSKISSKSESFLSTGVFGRKQGSNGEFKDEIMNVTMVDKEADSNHTMDIEELERLLSKDPQSHFMKIQGH
nr:epidermal patterning factor 1 [Tanacetum cinerariifolium]